MDQLGDRRRFHLVLIQRLHGGKAGGGAGLGALVHGCFLPETVLDAECVRGQPRPRQRDRGRTDRGQARGVEREKLVRFMKSLTDKRSARTAAGGEDVVRPGDIIADRFGVWRPGIPNPRGGPWRTAHPPRRDRPQFKMFGRSRSHSGIASASVGTTITAHCPPSSLASSPRCRASG